MVVMPDGITPAAGVVAVLLHPTRDDSIVARAVTNDRGRFLLKATPVTDARLRLLRIGYEPMQAGAFALGAGEVRDVAFTLSDLRIVLNTVDVRASSRCQIRPNGAQLVAQLFVQARTALIASTAPLAGTSTARFVRFQREQNRQGELVAPIQRAARQEATMQPFASLSVDSLAKVGYVVRESQAAGAGGEFYAPDANVLLSDTFLAQHCLQLVQSPDSQPGSIGIGFKPARTNGDRVDISGVLWLDRATSELQFLEYTYENLPARMRGAGLGGRVEYAQLANGNWFVSRWSIRMPILGVLPGRDGPFARLTPTERVIATGQLIQGGEVQSISVDDQVLFLSNGALLAGQQPQDREATQTLADARADVPLDEFGVWPSEMQSCRDRLTLNEYGIVKGRVLDAQKTGLPGVEIRAQ